MPLPRPTDGELAILRVLWDRGPSTVKDIHLVVQKKKDTAYTTVLRTCQVMHEKGLLARDEAERQHVYAPALTEEETQRGLLGDLLEKAFRGSAATLVLRALDRQRPEELEAVQKLVAKLKKERRP